MAGLRYGQQDLLDPYNQGRFTFEHDAVGARTRFPAYYQRTGLRLDGVRRLGAVAASPNDQGTVPQTDPNTTPLGDGLPQWARTFSKVALYLGAALVWSEGGIGTGLKVTITTLSLAVAQLY